jgi:hypothetical protein
MTDAPRDNWNDPEEVAARVARVKEWRRQHKRLGPNRFWQQIVWLWLRALGFKP